MLAHNLWMLKRFVPVRGFVEGYTSGVGIKALNHKQDLESLVVGFHPYGNPYHCHLIHLIQAWSLKIHKHHLQINGISVKLVFQSIWSKTECWIILRSTPCVEQMKGEPGSGAVASATKASATRARRTAT